MGRKDRGGPILRLTLFFLLRNDLTTIVYSAERTTMMLCAVVAQASLDVVHVIKFLSDRPSISYCTRTISGSLPALKLFVFHFAAVLSIVPSISLPISSFSLYLPPSSHSLPERSRMQFQVRRLGGALISHLTSHSRKHHELIAPPLSHIIKCNYVSPLLGRGPKDENTQKEMGRKEGGNEKKKR